MVHSFADDAQLYIETKVQPLECFYRLKLNPDKSEVIWLGTRQKLAKLSLADKTLQLHDRTLTASATVCNLGVQLDNELNFDDQA